MHGGFAWGGCVASFVDVLETRRGTMEDATAETMGRVHGQDGGVGY